jgi:uncharacterized protein with GYD domain
MPKYLTLFSFKGETLARLIDKPSDREAAVRRLAEAVGGTLEAYYVMFGQYDGCAIVEAPDSVSVAAAVVAVGATGAFSALETHELLSAAQFTEVLEKAKGITGYSPPGA